MWNEVSAVYDTKRLFSHSLLEVNFLCVILRGGPVSMVCDITTSLEVGAGPIFSESET